MATPRILEGTWEELAVQADQFKGRRLQLIVLPNKTTHEVDAAEQERLREAAFRVFEEADRTPREPGKTLNDPFDAEVGRMIEEKHRKLGLDI